MAEQVVWIKGCVPRDKPKVQAPYAYVDFAVTVDEVGQDEAQPVADFRAATGWRAQDETEFRIVERDGRLWRPINVAMHHGEEVPSAVSVLSRKDDNPLHKAAFRLNRQNDGGSPEEIHPHHADEAMAALLGREIEEAARDVCIIGGVAHRTCEEPTWIVVPARFRTEGMLVQPFCGRPGFARDAAWFSHSRRDEALAFAGEMAAARGTEAALRGSLHVEASFISTFDDVGFAEERVLNAFTRSIGPLWGTLPADLFAMAAEAARMEGQDRPGAVALAMKVAAELSALAGRPEVDALLSAAGMPLAQSHHFYRNAIFSAGDETALDTLAFPSP